MQGQLEGGDFLKILATMGPIAQRLAAQATSPPRILNKKDHIVMILTMVSIGAVFGRVISPWTVMVLLLVLALAGCADDTAHSILPITSAIPTATRPSAQLTAGVTIPPAPTMTVSSG
jgi:Na+/H+ antiporter NhaC